MTAQEKIAAKAAVLMEQFGQIRHSAIHNGAAIGLSASAEEIAEHVAECDPAAVANLWNDVMTIDKVKKFIWQFTPAILAYGRRPTDKTTEDLLKMEVNDASLVNDHKSWAVVRITKHGTEVLTCGGDYYQRYHIENSEAENSAASGEETAVTDAGTEEASAVAVTWTQEGETDFLKSELGKLDSDWTAHCFEVQLDGSHSIYSEGGTDYYVVPCDLPVGLDQLLTMCIYRSNDNGDTQDVIQRKLHEVNCNTSTDGMIGLPYGIWIIRDNSALASAPKGLLVPTKEVIHGEETGIKWDRLEIRYQMVQSGLERLKLLSDVFGDEYVISTQDDTLTEPTWKADTTPPDTKTLTVQDAINLRVAFAVCKRNMVEAGMDVSSLRYAKDVPPILENYVPGGELADMAAELAADPYVAELRETMTDLADRGILFDAIYEPEVWKKEQCDTFRDAVEVVYNLCKYELPGNDAPFMKKEGSNA